MLNIEVRASSESCKRLMIRLAPFSYETSKTPSPIILVTKNGKPVELVKIYLEGDFMGL